MKTFADTTTFAVSDRNDPDVVLRRFQRALALEKQGDSDIDKNRDLSLTISSLRENFRENNLKFERLKSRFEKLCNEYKMQKGELQKWCTQIDFLNERLENISHLNECTASTTQSSDDEVRCLRERVAMFEETFGLRILRTKEHENIQIIFSGCCEDDYTFRSYVILRMQSEGSTCQTQILECNPPVKDIEKLVEHCNKTDDMRSFLIVLRQRFVKYFRLRKKIESNRCS